MTIQEVIMKFLDKGYTISKHPAGGYEAISPKEIGYNRLHYYIFINPIYNMCYICSLTTKKGKDIEGRHILSSNFNLFH